MKSRFGKLLTAVTLLGAPASALASPRTLASGAPACGNTMGKGKSYGDGCTAEERAEWRAEVAREEREEQAELRHERARRAAAKARVARQEALKAVVRSADTLGELALLTVDPLRRLRS